VKNPEFWRTRFIILKKGWNLISTVQRRENHPEGLFALRFGLLDEIREQLLHGDGLVLVGIGEFPLDRLE